MSNKKLKPLTPKEMEYLLNYLISVLHGFPTCITDFLEGDEKAMKLYARFSEDEDLLEECDEEKE